MILRPLEVSVKHPAEHKTPVPLHPRKALNNIADKRLRYEICAVFSQLWKQKRGLHRTATLQQGLRPQEITTQGAKARQRSPPQWTKLKLAEGY